MTAAMEKEFATRIEACQGCPERRGNRCRLANQIVSILARLPKAACPLGRWPLGAGENGRQGERETGRTSAPHLPRSPAPHHSIYPEAEHRPIRKLAAVTCHYNPCGYKLIEDNYHRFAKALPSGLELWTIELAYGEAPFRLPNGSRMLRVRGDLRHVLWQKERMLNLVIDALPADVDAVAWLDADLIWFNRDWANETRQLLERYNAVQLFEHITDTDREGHFGKRFPGHVHAKTHGLGYGRPGGAWAARREALAGGLYDRHAIGGGDSATLFAWEGRKELPQSLKYGTAWEQHYREWAAQSFGLVRSSLACVSGDVVHLYHGTRQNRQYVERYQIFHDHAYDPVRDVEIDPETGLLQWSNAARERKPELVRRVREYFEQRREDE